jgi:hypothetical protein
MHQGMTMAEVTQISIIQTLTHTISRTLKQLIIIQNVNLGNEEYVESSAVFALTLVKFRIQKNSPERD